MTFPGHTAGEVGTPSFLPSVPHNSMVDVGVPVPVQILVPRRKRELGSSGTRL